MEDFIFRPYLWTLYTSYFNTISIYFHVKHIQNTRKLYSLLSDLVGCNIWKKHHLFHYIKKKKKKYLLQLKVDPNNFPLRSAKSKTYNFCAAVCLSAFYISILDAPHFWGEKIGIKSASFIQ